MAAPPKPRSFQARICIQADGTYEVALQGGGDIIKKTYAGLEPALEAIRNFHRNTAPR